MYPYSYLYKDRYINKDRLYYCLILVVILIIIGCQVIMGVLESREEFRWNQGYELIDLDNNDKVLKLMSRVGENEYIGKEYLCQGVNQIQAMEMLIDHKILKPSPFLMQLRRVATKRKDNVCSSSKLFYLIFEKPFQTLKEECIERRIKSVRFSEEELDCILEACVKALFYLKGMNESHRNISTSNIFIREDRTVILGDPWVLGKRNNNLGLTYPSPQKILFQNHLIHAYNYLLSDLFSLGVVMLECLCLENMDDIYQKGFRRIKYTAIIQKVNLAGSEALKLKLRMLLDHEPTRRSEVFRLCNRKQPLRTAFISQAKLEFKKNYVLSHLDVEEVKTVKPVQEDRQTIINKINESRDQQEFSVATEPKSNNPRHLRVFATNTHAPQSQYRLQPQYSPFQFPKVHFSHPSAHTSFTYQQIPTISSIQAKNQADSQNIQNIQFAQQQEIYQQNIKKLEDHFQEKMSLSSIHQHSSRQSEDISNIEIITDTKQQQPIITQIPQAISHQKKNSTNQEPKIKEMTSYQITDKAEESPEEKDENHLNIQQYMRMNSTIKQLSDESPSRQDFDQVTGQHQIIYQTGTRYKGIIKNGKRNGVGTLYFKDGCYYSGQWNENKMHGKGKLFSSTDKLIYDGNWYRDSFHGQGLLYNLDPTPLTIPFDYRNLSHIEDVWEEYRGDFFWDKKHGKGRIVLTNGEVFEGLFDNNHVHGEGTYQKINGEKVSGVWKSGILTETR